MADTMQSTLEDPQHEGATAMALVRPSRPLAIFGRLLGLGFVVLVVVLIITPWQQSSAGSGRVIAYAPEERRQNLEAPIEGRILRWYVREGSQVKQGEPLVELSDNDPDIMVRLRNERDAIATRVDAARARARSLESRIDSLEDSKKSSVSAAESRVRMAAQRVSAAEQAVTLAMATLDTARLNIERQKGLNEKGLTSKRQLELTELEERRAETELERAKVALGAAKSEEAALSSDRAKAGNDANASINDARASQSAAESEVANASAELARIEVRLARQSAQLVAAPRDGTVLRVVANGHVGEIVKSGDVLAVLVPTTADRAVEMWITGNDIPLIREGAQARVQFEGWPALQFSGWPSVAVGTFSGHVSFVDAADNGAGLFRVLIVPNEGDPIPWPSAIYLRQGARVQGWVQLGRVRLGYELWRQLNGFPPSLPKEPDVKDKKEALPK